MKIIVLNGSPKGEISVTMQYVRYIQKSNPSHEFQFLNISHEINGIEREQAQWQAILEAVQSSDGVLWATPVYYFLVPSQLKRFIELIWERQAERVFAGKYAAALITSIHCMDHTAINYLTGISEDLGMRFAGGFTPEMDDLELTRERTNLLSFAAWFLHAIETGLPTLRSFAPVDYSVGDYRPEGIAEVAKTAGRKVVLVTDGNDPDSNLARMITAFRQSLPNPVEVIDLNEVEIRGGCLGCIRCGYDNTCAYQDGLKRFIREKLIPAGAIIFAGAIRDRYLSSRWKRYFDRSFVFGHTPYLHGKQIGFIVSGPLRQLPNLRQVFEAYTQAQQCALAGFATDEGETKDVTAGLQALAAKLSWALEHDLQAPPNYLSFGAHLLFRDFIPMNRGIFRADHIFYKQHGLYQDHHKDLRHRMGSLMLIAMSSVPSLRKELQKQMKSGMIAGLKKIVDS